MSISRLQHILRHSRFYISIHLLTEYPNLLAHTLSFGSLRDHFTFLGATLPLSDAGDAVFAFCSSCARYRRANTLK